MKIISLNTAYGLYLDPLLEFITAQKQDTDIFCLQEVSDGSKSNKGNLLQTLQDILQEYESYTHDTSDYDAGTIVTFIKKDKQVQDTQRLLFAHELVDIGKDETRNNISIGLSTDILYNNQNIKIFNFHGLWHPGNKRDEGLRNLQYNNLMDYLGSSQLQTILLGDFNAHPDTKLIKTLSERYTNLNIIFSIMDTRGPGSKYYGTSEYQSYADYGFISPDMIAQSFITYEQVVSDHKALILSL